MSKINLTRRSVLQTGAITGAGLALPTYLSAASHSGFTNAPTGDTVTLGFKPYHKLDRMQMKALTNYAHTKLAVDHLNGGGDGGFNEHIFV